MIFTFAFSCQSEEKQVVMPKKEREVEVVKPEDSKVSEMLELQGVAVPAKTIDVVFNVAGVLENGEINFQKGMKFRKNQLLFQVNNRDAFLKMLSGKKALKLEVENMMQEMGSGFPAEKNKWIAFTASLGPETLIDDFPQVKTAEEQKLVNEKVIQETYQKVKKQESAMSDYFYIARFDGIVYDRFVKEGQKIAVKQRVAQLAQPGKFRIKCILHEELFAKAAIQISVFNKQHELIGHGKIEEVVPGKDGSADLFLSLDNGKKLAFGTEVLVSITR